MTDDEELRQSIIEFYLRFAGASGGEFDADCAGCGRNAVSHLADKFSGVHDRCVGFIDRAKVKIHD